MIAFSLLVMAAGYFVFAHASAQKNDVRSFGRIIGILIVIASLLGVVCGVQCKASGPGCGMMGGSMKMHGKSFCPIK